LLQKRLAVARAGVRDEYIQSAEVCHDLGDAGLDGGRVGDVDAVGVRADAVLVR
jgi:hypothetical protein